MEQTKICSECGQEKPLSEFNKNRGSKDGLQDRCRSCFSRYNKARYASDPERHKRNVRTYRENNPRKVFESRLKTCEKNPSKARAYKVVEAALACGEISNPGVCYGCGCSSDEHRIEAHHHDYSKPLEIIWLCTPCHRRMDAQRRVREGKKPYGERGGTDAMVRP